MNKTFPIYESATLSEKWTCTAFQTQRIAQLTYGLEVEGDHLAASIPKHLWHVVGRVYSCSLGVNPAQLHFVVSEQ